MDSRLLSLSMVNLVQHAALL